MLITPSCNWGKRYLSQNATRNGLNIHTFTTNIVNTKALRFNKAIDYKLE